MLTLERPATGDGDTDVLTAVADGSIVPPNRRAPDRSIPVELSAIAMKAMRHDRRERYQTVRELAGDIQRFLDGRTVLARRDSLLEASRKLVRRNPKVAITAACAALLLAVITGTLLLGLKSERDYAVTQWELANKARAAAADAQREQYETALAASQQLAGQAIRAEEQGRPAEADLRADAALTLLPDGPWGHYALAAISHARHDHAAAQQHLKRALELKQSHGPSRALLSSIHVSAGEMKLADELLTNLDDTEDWRSLLRVVKPLLKVKRYKEALQVCERLAGMAPSVRGLTDEAKDRIDYVLGYARAEVACIGFPESLQGLSPEEQKAQVLAKFRELHGGQDVIKILNETECQSLDPRCVHLQPLRGTAYTSLYLSTCQVRDLEPLRGHSLEFLEISQAKVTDLDPLRGMPLKTLNLRHCKIDDLTPLQDLTVESMTLYGLPVADLSPLSGMPLKTLHIVTCPNVTDLTSLKGAPLDYLNLGGTGVSDLSPLKDAPITGASIKSNRITDYSPIATWPLESIGVTVASLDVLKDASLHTVQLQGSTFRNLDALRGKPLRQVLLTSSHVEDISGLEGAPITALEIDRCGQISDFRVLKSLSSLTSLRIGQTRLTDLSLINYESLRSLYIQGLSVSDLSPLSGTRIQILDLTDTPVTDLTPLADLPLTELHPPLKDQLTPKSLTLIEKLQQQGCKITWE